MKCKRIGPDDDELRSGARELDEDVFEVLIEPGELGGPAAHEFESPGRTTREGASDHTKSGMRRPATR
jgi:hypothetical protein